MAAPDFVAGFIYGMTGDNHLTEIEACYNGGYQIVKDSQTALAEFKAGQYFAGLKEAGFVWSEVDSSLITCKGMSDDIAAIELWSQIFTDPAKLSKTVAKNWLLHGSKIKADVDTVQADWSANDYFKAGQDTADALTLAVGPIRAEAPKALPQLDLLMVPELAAGFLYGMVGDNHLSEFQSCYTGITPLWTDLEAALKDIEAFNIFGAIKEFEKFVFSFQTDSAPCHNVSDDLKAVEAWAQIFKSPTSLVSTVTKHYLLHKGAITADITATKTDYAAKSYFAAGKDAADLLTILMGPIQ